MTTKITAISLFALTIIGCKSVKDSNTETTTAIPSENIFDITWTLSKLDGATLENSEQNGQTIHFTLHSEDNRVSGYSGCNTFMGIYTVEKGNRISFSQLASTRMACPDSQIKEQEILDIFNLADNYSTSGNTLTLNKAKRAPLAVFYKSHTEKITEKYWKLKTLEGGEVQMADNQEREIYFMLKTNENRLEGFSGCNMFAGSYTLEEGHRIRFTQMASTMKACPDVDVNESEFLKVFELADNYSIKDDILSLNVGKRAALAVFEAVYF